MIQGERLAFSDVSFLLLQNLFKPMYVSVQITFNEILKFLEKKDVHLRKKFLGYQRKEIKGLRDFGSTLLVFVFCLFVFPKYTFRKPVLHTNYCHQTLCYQQEWTLSCKFSCFGHFHTAQNVKISVKDFFSKFWSHFDRIWLYLLKKSFIKNLIFVQCHQLPFAGSVRGFVNAHAHNPCFNLSFSLQNYR